MPSLELFSPFYSIHPYLKVYYSVFLLARQWFAWAEDHTLEAQGDPRISVRRAAGRPHPHPSMKKAARFCRLRQHQDVVKGGAGILSCFQIYNC